MPKKTSIGGQAVIEGIMMKGPKKTALAVRIPDGSIDIEYIKEKLIPYPGNQIVSSTLERITAKQAAQWDLLQLADVCATTMFLAYQENGWGFCTPCFSRVLRSHLYAHRGKIDSYGIKYFTPDMKPDVDDLKDLWVCTKKERTPGATST